MERSGLGVDRIFEDQLKFGKLPPFYDSDRTSVHLRLEGREFDEPFARMVLSREQAGKQWRVGELLTLSHLRRMGPSDHGALAKVMQRPEEDAFVHRVTDPS
jgi:ATP-dependent DNA helicase RecG